MFKIGDTVLCIDDTNQKFNVLKKDKEYIVRGLCCFGLGIYVEGIYLMTILNGEELGHKAERFRISKTWANNLLNNISFEVDSSEELEKLAKMKERIDYWKQKFNEDE